MLTASLEGVEEWVTEALASVDVATPDALTAGAQVVATEAQRSHAYQNRTHLLETSTFPGAPSGSFVSGSAETEVIADTDYAQYVDERPGFAFLQPAWDRSEERAEGAALRVLERALRGL